jgi:Cys-tRNA(Pro) deacylase
MDDASRIARVQAALDAVGYSGAIMRVSGSTHTAEQAAAAAGCALGQIIKTLAVYVAGTPMLALVAGDRRLDDRLVAARAGVGRKQVKLASPEQVLELSGYPVGGVSPFGLSTPLPAVVDASLRRFDTVWVAAGAATAILPIALDDLVRYVGGEFAEVSS